MTTVPALSSAITTTVPKAFAETLSATRQALADQGFGVLTEIDIQATLKAKLDVAVPAQVIQGACRPSVANTVDSLQLSRPTG